MSLTPRQQQVVPERAMEWIHLLLILSCTPAPSLYGRRGTLGRRKPTIEYPWLTTSIPHGILKTSRSTERRTITTIGVSEPKELTSTSTSPTPTPLSYMTTPKASTIGRTSTPPASGTMDSASPRPSIDPPTGFEVWILRISTSLLLGVFLVGAIVWGIIICRRRMIDSVTEDAIKALWVWDSNRVGTVDYGWDERRSDRLYQSLRLPKTANTMATSTIPGSYTSFQSPPMATGLQNHHYSWPDDQLPPPPPPVVSPPPTPPTPIPAPPPPPPPPPPVPIITTAQLHRSEVAHV